MSPCLHSVRTVRRFRAWVCKMTSDPSRARPKRHSAHRLALQASQPGLTNQTRYGSIHGCQGRAYDRAKVNEVQPTECWIWILKLKNWQRKTTEAEQLGYKRRDKVEEQLSRSESDKRKIQRKAGFTMCRAGDRLECGQVTPSVDRRSVQRKISKSQCGSCGRLSSLAG